jgi:hypothetical protein
MISVRRRWSAVLAVPAVIGMAALGLAVPAQAQPNSSSPHSTYKHGPDSSASKSWLVSDPAAFDRAVKSKNWVYTPDGLVYKTCVSYAPNYSVVKNGEIIEPSGAVHLTKPCAYPMLAYPGGQDRAQAQTARASEYRPAQNVPASGPCYFGKGGDWWAASCWGSPNWLEYDTENYAVPSDPAKDGALIFLFGGLEDSSGDTILQGVLTWGANGSIVTNPNIWYITPWYCYPKTCVHGSSIHVAPVDTINSWLSAISCKSDGECTWDIGVIDENNGAESIYTVGSGVPFIAVLGGVMEVPRASGCVETPTNGHAAFRSLAVENNDGQFPTPSFGLSTPDPQCSVSIRATSDSADILWKS